MKSIIFNTAVIATLLFSGMTSGYAANIRIGETLASRIAKDVSIPGKGKAGQCLPFAVALQKKLAAAGIPAQVVVYGYEAGGVPVQDVSGELTAQPVLSERGSRGSHAVVVYDDGGRTYVMDNQAWVPQWVHNASAMQMAQQFSGIHSSVKMARVLPGGGNPEATLRSMNTRLAAK